MKRASKFLLGFTALALMAGIRPRVSPCAEPAPHEVQVSIQKGTNGSHIIEGRFSVIASSRTAWRILSNYDNLSSFVSSVRLSRKVYYDGGDWVVEQVMAGKAGPFHKKIHLFLGVEESAESKIVFRDLSKKSFKSYSGSWEIVNREDDIEVRYLLDATPAFFAPDFIAMGAFKRSVTLLLTEVRDEILVRDKE